MSSASPLAGYRTFLACSPSVMMAMSKRSPSRAKGLTSVTSGSSWELKSRQRGTPPPLIFLVSGLRIAHAAVVDFFEALAGTQKEFVPEMLTRRKLYAIICGTDMGAIKDASRPNGR